MPLKYRDLIKLLEADGWYWVSTTGSHQKYRHLTKKGTVIVPARGLGSDVKVGLERAILEASGVSMMAKYTAIFEKAEDGTWGGYFPDCSVVLVNGNTLDEAQENARTGLELWIEDRKEQGLPLPVPTTEVRAFEVAA